MTIKGALPRFWRSRRCDFTSRSDPASHSMRGSGTLEGREEMKAADWSLGLDGDLKTLASVAAVHGGGDNEGRGIPSEGAQYNCYRASG